MEQAPSQNEGPLNTYRLRDYQRQIARAVIDSVFNHKGLTFSVEIARQGGKNELSAQLELLLLTLHINYQGNLIKCAPTFKPQAVLSMNRLKDRLNTAGFAGIWRKEHGYIMKLGEARMIFLSAEKNANVVGNTAHILLEIDESQDVDKDKYTKEFKPMGATENTTIVHYGTTWNDNTLLEEVKQHNIELEKRDGIKRHFRFDWEEVALHNPAYRKYVEAERQRLGDDHPLFRTQYRLLLVKNGGGFFDHTQLTQMQGTHSRQRHPEKGKKYVAGIDLAGGIETEENGYGASSDPRRDAVVITIAELDYSIVDAIITQPAVKIVEHYCWTGEPHPRLYPRMVDILNNVWNCKRIVVDATGIGYTVAAFLRKAIGVKVIPFVFTMSSKSKLGFDLLAAVNSGRVKMFAKDNSTEYRKFRQEIEKAKSVYRANHTMNFYVETGQGHDDFLMSLALTVESANGYKDRSARGIIY